MAIPQRRHPAATLLAMVIVLAGTVALAEYVSKSRLRKLEVEMGPPQRFGEVELSFPLGWTAHRSDWRMDLAKATKSGFPTDVPLDPEVRGALLEGMPGSREMAVSIERPREPMTADVYVIERFTSDRLGGSPFSVAELAGRPARRLVMSLGQTEEEGFRMVVAAALPSGRILCVRMEGAGEATDGDRRAFEATCAAVSVSGEASVDADPFRALRYGTPAPPLEQLRNEGSIAGERALARVGNAEVALAIHPVYLPVIASAATTQPETNWLIVGGQQPTAARRQAELIAKSYVALHSLALAGTQPRWVSPTRLVFSRPGMAPPMAAMVVWAEPGSASGALILASGSLGSEREVAASLGKAADAMVFDRRPEGTESPEDLVASGVRLAQRAGEATGEDLFLVWRRSGQTVGWTAIGSGGQVISQRRPGPSEAYARARLTVEPARGGAVRIIRYRQRFDGEAFGQEESLGPWTIPAALAAATVPRPAVVGDRMEMASDVNFVPASLLLQVAPLAGTEPAIVWTSAVPWAHLDGQAPAWFVLIAPVSGQAGAWNLHVLGTSVTLRAKYGPDNRLTSVENVGAGETATAYRERSELELQLPRTGPLAPPSGW
jgi:hypothetical protein